MTFIAEESVMKYLYWYSPILSAMIMSLHIIENVVRYPDTPILFCYSFCKKSPFPPYLFNEIVVFNSFVAFIMTPSLIAEMCIHITVLVKQTNIENRASVYIVKNDQRVSRQRHTRNVISAVGHFLSFALSMLETFLLVHAFYFFKDIETVATIRNVNMFLLPSIIFLVYPLIETLFSENLRGSFCFSPKSIWQIEL